MNRSWIAALSLAPLLGASQTLVQAGTMALLGLTALFIHRGVMVLLRRWLDARPAKIASLFVAASVVTCQSLTLQAWAPGLYLMMGIYPGLVALQCVLIDHALGKGGQWHRITLLLGGVCTAHLLLGASRELLASGTLHMSLITGPDTTGLRLAGLAPGALLLLGVLLALIKRACPEQATQTAKEKADP